MKITIIAVGKEKDFVGSELVAEYNGRIEHYNQIEWLYIPASDKAEEEKRILKVLDSHEGGSHIIMLDELGKQYTSTQFSEFIQKRLNEGLKSVVFLIGGSYGFGDAVRARANSIIALSSLTFPHQLIRLILAEQLYRVFTILKGEKYHH